MEGSSSSWCLAAPLSSRLFCSLLQLHCSDVPPCWCIYLFTSYLLPPVHTHTHSATQMGSQCYGFVEFGSALESEQALQLVADRDAGFCVNGGFIRASRAQGSMPTWKQGKAVISKRDLEQGLEGLEAYEHPTARMVRLQAAAAAATVPAAVVPPVVPVVPLGGVMPAAAAQARQMIDYGDL